MISEENRYGYKISAISKGGGHRRGRVNDRQARDYKRVRLMSGLDF
jgi:hypothetical protein